MKKIFALLLGALSVWSAAAQRDVTEPYLPPMEDFGSPQVTASTVPPTLTMRGMDIDDGYGILSPYGAAMLFGGTPAHNDYMNGIQYRSISAYTLWPGIGLSVGGIVFMVSSGLVNDGNDRSGLQKEYRNSVVTAGAVMLAVGVGATAVGATFRVKAKRSFSRAVDIYNEYTRSSYDPPAPELSIGFTPGGVGVAYCF